MRTDDIVKKVFSRSFMGYDVQEVDLFLDDVIVEIEKSEAEKTEMLAALEYLLGKLERGERLPSSEARRALTEGRDKPRQKKRALPAGSEPEQQEQKPNKPARALQRPAPRKPAAGEPAVSQRIKRVPKKTEENSPAPVAVEYETMESAPSRMDWMDELLDEMQADVQSVAEESAAKPEEAKHAAAPHTEPEQPAEPSGAAAAADDDADGQNA